MHSVIMLAAFLFAILPAPSVPLLAGARSHRVARDNSDRVVFASESSEVSDGNRGRASAGRSGVLFARTSTTLGPRMTFRGRAPAMESALPTVVTTTPTTEITRWYRKFIPTALPNFVDRVGEFFGKKKATTVAPTTESTPLLHNFDANVGHSAEGSSNVTEVDIRGIIDAPAINGDCPSTHRLERGRCRKRM